MGSNWHHAFNPQSFLRGVKLDQLLKRNDAYADNRISKLGRPCISCGSTTGPGLLLNEGSYLCAQCFDRLSLVQYPEKYEGLWRNFLIAKEARNKARHVQNAVLLCASFVLGPATNGKHSGAVLNTR